MKLSDFDYYLPKERIAQYPLVARDNARLMVVNRATGSIEHRIFSEISTYLKPNDILVLNDTKVVPCRLKGTRKTGGQVEAFLLKHEGNARFSALLKPGRLKTGEEISFDNGSLRAIIEGRREIRFLTDDAQSVYRHGLIPLPPYIKRACEPLDADYYQTVYAAHDGAVAAPTAGLHFTEKNLREISLAGTAVVYVTLHVGLGTFNPVKVQDIRQHQMDYEEFFVSAAAKNKIEATKKTGGRVFAVGTTSCRCLETLAQGKDEGLTNIFMYPGYRFQLVDCLLTNFHLPQTTLFMLVCAFAGVELMKRAYAEAIQKEYRFYSYGDAMVIL
ncbi:MAG TPA: tRNA preQ1(34) S-adenosylmethionine ribosyltransferase-isomerase QueA [Candidatus Omnitrophota bacterium]|nr:tRNA preQ1(34) S-adenosylmethionine ribosyltransferase-isomerase QueA [Candidatus Omnitrophota bacterium]HPT06759.1 tRNA preQ1(34) S-adenosylmethionine ribosyltransferase-isomerase QueA [Candidatus Omnitrophota bacterium]